MEDGGDSESPAGALREVLGVAGEGGEGVGSGAEEEIECDSGPVECQGAELVGQREDDVEVFNREKVGAPRLEPVDLRQCLTLRAVTVAAGVVDSAPMPIAVRFGSGGSSWSRSFSALH